MQQLEVQFQREKCFHIKTTDHNDHSESVRPPVMREICAEARPSWMVIMRVTSAALFPLFPEQQVPAGTEEYSRCGESCLEFGKATNTR